MPTFLDPPREVLPTARPFTLAEARSVGVSSSALTRLVQAGVLRRIVQGVYVDACVPDSLDLRCRALASVIPPGAVVADRTAAWLHGVSILRAGEQLSVPSVRVVRVPDGSRLRRSSVDGGLRMLRPADVEVVTGVPVTTALRTACDLGRLLRRDDAFAALDALLRTGRFEHPELLAELDRFRGFRGIRQLRVLAPWADPRAESPPESVLRLRWLDEGLPTPETQIPFLDASGRERFRGDLGVPELRLLVEYDGRDHHTTPEDRGADQRRRAIWRAHGWIVIVVTAEDLRDPRLGARLRAAVREAQERVALAA
ncbi:MAG: type IV toxin-antitoxin system AbiEi family antitoxin domain-containing protein [Propionibacteriaceae bacterium]